jgi:putative membrane protein
VAIVLGVLNVFLKPLLVILTLPVTILTLGLFSFVINIALVYLAAYVVPGFEISGILAALLFGLLVSLISSFLNILAR